MKSVLLLLCFDFTIRAVLGESEPLYNRLYQEHNDFRQNEAEQSTQDEQTPELRRYYECYEVVESIDPKSKDGSLKVRNAKKVFSSLSKPPPDWTNLFKPAIKRIDPRLIAHNPQIQFYGDSRYQQVNMPVSSGVPESEKSILASKENELSSRRRHPGLRRVVLKSWTEHSEVSPSENLENKQTLPETRQLPPKPIETSQASFIQSDLQEPHPEGSNNVHQEPTQATPRPMMKVLNEFAHDMASYFFKSSTTAPVRIAKNETEHNDESVANSVQEFNPSALKEPSALPTQNPGTAPSQIPFVDEVLEKTFQQEEVVVDPSESQRATASYFQGTTSSLPVPVETRSAVQDISDPQAIPDFAKTVVQDLTTEMPPPIATSMAIQTHTGTQAISSGAYSMVQELGSENQLSNEILSMPNQIPPLEQKVPEDLNAQEQSITGQTLKMAAEQVTLPPAQVLFGQVVWNQIKAFNPQIQAPSTLPAVIQENHANFYEFTTHSTLVQGPSEGGIGLAQPATGRRWVQGLDTISFGTQGVPEPKSMLKNKNWSQYSQSAVEQQSSVSDDASTYQTAAPILQESSIEGIDSSSEDVAAEFYDANDNDGERKVEQKEEEKIAVLYRSSGESTKSGETVAPTTRMTSFVQEGLSTDQIIASNQEASVQSAPLQGGKFSTIEKEVNSALEQGEKLTQFMPVPLITSFSVVKSAPLPKLSNQEVEKELLGSVNTNIPNDEISLVPFSNGGGRLNTPDATTEQPATTTPSHVPRQVGINLGSHRYRRPIGMNSNPNLPAPRARLSPELRKVLNMETAPMDPEKSSTYRLDPQQCSKLRRLANVYGITDAAEWTKNNCNIAQLYFPNASCEQLNQYVASCYRMMLL